MKTATKNAGKGGERRMSKSSKRNRTGGLVKPSLSQSLAQGDFDAVLGLIEAARTRAVAAVNTALIDLYWNIGEYISRRIAAHGYGQATVMDLSE
jgi:hypothetical protein